MEKPVHLLFVCIKNSNRSQLAEAWARILGGDRVVAYSAGVSASREVCPRAIESMAQLNYDMSGHTSKPLQDLPVIKFDAVVCMGASEICPEIPARYRDEWAIPDSRHLPDSQYRAVRELIGWRVYDLLLDLGVSPVRVVNSRGCNHWLSWLNRVQINSTRLICSNGPKEKARDSLPISRLCEILK